MDDGIRVSVFAFSFTDRNSHIIALYLSTYYYSFLKLTQVEICKICKSFGDVYTDEITNRYKPRYFMYTKVKK